MVFPMTKVNVKQLIRENKTDWIQLHFTDIIGRLRVLHMPSDRFLDGKAKDGIGFDGSSVGFAAVEKSDMMLLPDESTFLPLPHEKNEARIIGEIYDSSLKPFPAGPRQILKKAIQAANKAGFDEIKFSPEMEFYVMDEHDSQEDRIIEQQGYFAPPSLDEVKGYRKELTEMLSKSGYKIKYHHHEGGKCQHEVEINSIDVLSAADYCIYFKYLAREIARMYNLLVTFMPKPVSNDAGNGMHAHTCFYKNGKNMFMDENDDYRLSQTARYFIGGILEHARGMAAIANPTLNSYKRLIPNFEAPIYVAWAQHNRSALIRIPARKNVDVEVRNPDPAANPYLLYAAMIYAGLDGIKKKIECDPIEKNIYKMSERVKDLGIKKLPTNLNEALEALKSDGVLCKSLGDETINLFTKYKDKEWQHYIGETTDLEYRLYFHC
jgi:glutamine synthetase